MKAIEVSAFGPAGAMHVVEVPKPSAAADQVLVKVEAVGVGPWDAWVRSGKSVIDQKLPLTPGSDIAGTVAAIGTGVSGFREGDSVYGVTNKNFTGGYAEYAVASSGMLALKPERLNFVEAASVPVVAVTAYQMLFQYAELKAQQSVLVLGGAGNVGAYAVQMARRANLRVAATCGEPEDIASVQALGAERVFDRSQKVSEVLKDVDAIIDTVGGAAREGAIPCLKRGGILVSSVSPIAKEMLEPFAVRGCFFLVDVTTARLQSITEMFERGELRTRVGTILPLVEAVRAHEMLEGAPHDPGKIVLTP